MRNVGEISDGTTIIRYGKTAAENLLEMVHCGKVCKFFKARVCWSILLSGFSPVLSLNSKEVT